MPRDGIISYPVYGTRLGELLQHALSTVYHMPRLLLSRPSDAHYSTFTLLVVDLEPRTPQR